MKDKSRSIYNQKDKFRLILHPRINVLLDIRSPESSATFYCKRLKAHSHRAKVEAKSKIFFDTEIFALISFA